MKTALSMNDANRTLEALAEHRLATAHKAADEITNLISQMGPWDAHLLDGLGLEEISTELCRRVEAFHAEVHLKLDGMSQEDRERVVGLTREIKARSGAGNAAPQFHTLALWR